MDLRIDALRTGGVFPSLGSSPPALSATATSETKKRPRDGLEEKYAHVKAQLATLDRTLRHELEQHEETQAQLVRATQERDVLKSDNAALRAKVEELYLAITKLSEGAAQDRQDAVAAALAQASNNNGPIAHQEKRGNKN